MTLTTSHHDPTHRGGPPARRRPAALAALTTVLVGAVLVGAATGATAPRVSPGGAPVVTAVLVLGSLLALALLVGGTVALGRTVRGGLRRTATLVPVALLVVAVVYVVAIPVTVTTAPGPPPATATPADVGLRFEDVSIPASDGARLAGWYVPSSNGAAVILLHGSGSTRASVLQHAAVVARHGYGVLMVDARGHGASTGRAMLWGWYGDVDLPRVAEHLAQRVDVTDDRIAAIGLSMGGEEAVGAAARTPLIRAVVAEGVTGRTGADLTWLGAAYGWRGTVTQRAHEVQTALADALAAAPRPPTLASAVTSLAPGSVLLVAAGTVPDERHAAAALQDAAPGVVEVWVAPGAGHTAALDAHPGTWEERVLDLLDRTVGPEAP